MVRQLRFSCCPLLPLISINGFSCHLSSFYTFHCCTFMVATGDPVEHRYKYVASS